jgi:hypothetical protein
MAATVVDRLEVIEIDIDERRARAVALDIGERALEFALKTAPVEDIGERIDVDPCLKLADARTRGFELSRQRVSAARRITTARDGARDDFGACGSSCSPA